MKTDSHLDSKIHLITVHNGCTVELISLSIDQLLMEISAEILHKS